MFHVEQPKLSRRGRARKAPPEFRWPDWVPENSLASVVELDTSRFRQMANDGYLPQPVKGLYDCQKALRGLFAFYRASLHNRQPMTDARLAKMAAEKAKLDLEIRRLSGKSIDTKVVAEVLVKVGTGIKHQLYQGLEKEMPARAGVDADTAARLAVLGREMADQMTAKMSESFRQWIEAPT